MRRGRPAVGDRRPGEQQRAGADGQPSRRRPRAARAGGRRRAGRPRTAPRAAPPAADASRRRGRARGRRASRRAPRSSAKRAPWRGDDFAGPVGADELDLEAVEANAALARTSNGPMASTSSKPSKSGISIRMPGCVAPAGRCAPVAGMPISVRMQTVRRASRAVDGVGRLRPRHAVARVRRRSEPRAVQDACVCAARGTVTPARFAITRTRPGSTRLAAADGRSSFPASTTARAVDPEVLDASRAAAARGARMVSICTGAFVLGRRGRCSTAGAHHALALRADLADAVPAVTSSPTCCTSTRATC